MEGILLRPSDIQKQKRLTLTLIKDNLNDIHGLDTRLSLAHMSVKDNQSSKTYVVIKNGRVETDFKKLKNTDSLKLLVKYLESIMKL